MSPLCRILISCRSWKRSAESMQGWSLGFWFVCCVGGCEGGGWFCLGSFTGKLEKSGGMGFDFGCRLGVPPLLYVKLRLNVNLTSPVSQPFFLPATLEGVLTNPPGDF